MMAPLLLPDLLPLVLLISISCTASTSSEPLTYMGCHVAKLNNSHYALSTNVTDRFLRSMMISTLPNRNRYLEMCAKACLSAENFQPELSVYSYFGLSNGSECWCGKSIQASKSISNSYICRPCPRNWHQNCGGPDAMDIYRFGVEISPTVPVPVIGCYLHHASRYMVLDEFIPIGYVRFNSQLLCSTMCRRMAKALAGLYGNFCSCGSRLFTELFQPTPGRCGIPCPGNSEELCGDSAYMLVVRAQPSP